MNARLPLDIGNIDLDPQNWNWLRNASNTSVGQPSAKDDILEAVPPKSPSDELPGNNGNWEPVSFAQKTVSGKIKVQLADLIKVGPEGYIHGYICVRPPCGRYEEAKREAHGGKTVTPHGHVIGRDLKKQPGDAGYSIRYHLPGEKKGVTLAGQYATRQDASKIAVLTHNIDWLSVHTKVPEAQGRLRLARKALIDGDHGTAVMHLAEAETKAAMSGDRVTSSHVVDVKGALIAGPQPVSKIASPEPVIHEMPPVAPAPKLIPERALQAARDGITHVHTWYHPRGEISEKLQLAENAMHQGGVERAAMHLRQAHILAVASGANEMATGIARAHDVVAKYLGIPPVRASARRDPLNSAGDTGVELSAEYSKALSEIAQLAQSEGDQKLTGALNRAQDHLNDLTAGNDDALEDAQAEVKKALGILRRGLYRNGTQLRFKISMLSKAMLNAERMPHYDEAHSVTVPGISQDIDTKTGYAFAQALRQEYDKAAEDLQHAMNSGVMNEIAPPVTGAVAQTSIITFNDGSQWVRKGFKMSTATERENAGYEVRNEIAGSLAARAIGVKSPAVAYGKSGEVWMEYVRGHTLAEAGDDSVHMLQSGDDNEKYGLRRMGVLDYVISNPDRHSGNIMQEDNTGDIVAIDHGMTWSMAKRGSTVTRSVNPGDIPQSEYQLMRERLAALEPEYSMLSSGRNMWNTAMDNLDDIAGKAARGDVVKGAVK